MAIADFLLKEREAQKLTRENVVDLTNERMTYARLEKIENDRATLHPEDVDILAEAYMKPELKHHYCKHVCPLGKDFREVANKDLGHIAIETVNSLNRINQIQQRLLDIVEDDTITSDEYEDFVVIKDSLEKIALAADNLKLWMEKAKLSGDLPDNAE